MRSLKLSQYPSYVIWLAMNLVIFIAIAFDVIYSAVIVWYDSETFNHCFFVLPICIYLSWKQRHNLAVSAPEFSPLFFFLCVLLVPIWMLAYAGSIGTLGHIASFAMLSCLVVAMLGVKLAKLIWFPLCFVFFAVPIGEELIPLFQRITADLSVRLLLLTGIPVFYEGLFISIPEGKFLVAEACSGVRFFVSTVMLGFFCSYILFNGWKRRILFILFSIFLPIAANIIRVYATMMVGHLVSMDMASGVDHLIYGWVFFAVIILLLVYVGNKFSDVELVEVDIKNVSVHDSWLKWPSVPVVMTFFLLFGLLFAWKSMIDLVDERSNLLHLDRVGTEFKQNTYTRTWQPTFPDATQTLSLSHREDGRLFELDVVHFSGADQSDELISWKNRVYLPDIWTFSSQDRGGLKHEASQIDYSIVHVVSNKGERRSILYWYKVAEFYSSNRVYIKLLQAYMNMMGGTRAGSFVSVSVSGGETEERTKRLKTWVERNYSGFSDIFDIEHHLEN